MALDRNFSLNNYIDPQKFVDAARLLIKTSVMNAYTEVYAYGFVFHMFLHGNKVVLTCPDLLGYNIDVGAEAPLPNPAGMKKLRSTIEPVITYGKNCYAVFVKQCSTNIINVAINVAIDRRVLDEQADFHKTGKSRYIFTYLRRLTNKFVVSRDFHPTFNVADDPDVACDVNSDYNAAHNLLPFGRHYRPPPPHTSRVEDGGINATPLYSDVVRYAPQRHPPRSR